MKALLLDGDSRLLLGHEKLSAERNEAWLRDLLFTSPDLVPVQAIDAGATLFVPICREMPLPRASGNVSLDVLGVTPEGRLILIECKLWRNPQARREVIGQILEYAALLRRLTYGDLVVRLKTKLGWTGANPLFEHVRRMVPALNEAVFTDGATRSLQTGDFMLIVAGDGIRSDMHAIAAYVNESAGHLGRLALVEFQLWHDRSGRTLVVPAVPFRTEVVQHRVVTDSTGSPLQMVAQAPSSASSEPIIDGVGSIDAAQGAEARRTIRNFWNRFIATVRFTHPDQPPPVINGPNNVRLQMPPPARWMTAYRTGGVKAGIFLLLDDEPGEVAYNALSDQQGQIEGETGLPLSFSIQSDPPFRGRISTQATVGSDEEDQFQWLASSADKMVTALRPRLSLLASPPA